MSYLQKIIRHKLETKETTQAVQHTLFGLMEGSIDFLRGSLAKDGIFMGYSKEQFLAKFAIWYARFNEEHPMIHVNNGVAQSDLPGEKLFELSYTTGRTIEEIKQLPPPVLGTPAIGGESILRFAMKVESGIVVKIVEPENFCDLSHLFDLRLDVGKN